MGKIYTKEQQINSYDCTCDYHLSPVALLNYFQQTSQEQSNALGVGPEVLDQKGLAWFLVKYHIDFMTYPSFCDTVLLETEAVSVRGFLSHRRFTMKSLEGKILAEGKTHWMMLDREQNNKILRVEDIPENAVYEAFDSQETYKMPHLCRVKKWEGEKQFQVRYLDIDFNGHVNHVKYLAWAIETLPLKRIRDSELASADLVYKQQAFYGDVIQANYKEMKDDCYRIDIINQDTTLLCQVQIILRRKANK